MVLEYNAENMKCDQIENKLRILFKIVDRETAIKCFRDFTK